MYRAVFFLLLLILASTMMFFLLVPGQRQLRRKLLRLVGLVFPLAVFPLWGINVYRVCLLIPSSLLLLLEIARLRSSGERSRLDRLVAPIAKKGEEGHIFGISTYFWGAMVASFAPEGIGPAVMAMATISDSWAAVAGFAWGGRRTTLGKTWVGSAACLLSALWMGSSFAGVFPWSSVSFPLVAVASPAIAAAERFTPGEYDNLAINITGAAAMVLTSLLIPA